MGNLIKVHGIVNLRRDVESGIFYTVMRHESKLITRSLSTKSKTTARLRHANVMAAILAPPAQPTPTAQMSEVIERYKKFITAHPDLKPRSKRYRIETLNCIIKSWPEFSAVKAEEVTMADCEAWRDRLLFSGMSAPRFNGCLCTLRGIFRIAISMGVRKENPATLLKPRRVKPRKLNLPTRDEFQQMIAEMRHAGGRWSQYAADLVEFLAYSGCRLGEAANVHWRDVDMAAGTMIIRGDPETGTKGGGIRSIPIFPALEELLRRLPRSSERVLHAISCYAAIKRACEKCGLTRLTHHDLRHLFATRCLQSGVDVPTVSRWLGHKDGGVLVLQTYSEYCCAHSQAMAQKVVLK
jgi:integrase